MQTHNLNGKEVLVLEVPEDCEQKPCIISHAQRDNDVVGFKNGVGKFIETLPSGKWAILLDTTTATEEDYGELAEILILREPVHVRHSGYLDSIMFKRHDSEGWCHTPKESFHSFLRSNGYDPGRRYLIISKQ